MNGCGQGGSSWIDGALWQKCMITIRMAMNGICQRFVDIFYLQLICQKICQKIMMVLNTITVNNCFNSKLTQALQCKSQ